MRKTLLPGKAAYPPGVHGTCNNAQIPMVQSDSATRPMG